MGANGFYVFADRAPGKRLRRKPQTGKMKMEKNQVHQISASAMSKTICPDNLSYQHAPGRVAFIVNSKTFDVLFYDSKKVFAKKRFFLLIFVAKPLFAASKKRKPTKEQR